ncbi:membrane protein [Pontibacter sp. HJ8]
MKAYHKVLMIFAALSLGLLFLFPMWKIYLEAPQYPEGLELHIWVNKLSGSSEGVLQNFNILNHYIGMEKIHAESFAELKIMPYIVVLFMVTGIIIALAGKRSLVLAWIILLLIAGAVGIADFYLWLHKFGTNLDPTAPIKVPGMTYIPPLLGNKQLLNFEALSLPAWGSLGIFLAVLIAGLVYILSQKKVKTEELNLA